MAQTAILGPVVGKSCKLYRNTGTYASPTWSEVSEIGDVSLPDLSMSMAELMRRSNLFKKQLAALIEVIAIEFNIISGAGDTTADAEFIAMRSNFFSGTAAEYLIYSGAAATENNQGLRLPAFVKNFPWNQPLESVSDHSIRLETAYMESPAGTERDPSWAYTDSMGAIVDL